MSAAQVLTPLPPLTECDPEHYEIVDGVRLELPPMSAESTGVTADVAFALTGFGLAHNLGKAYPEMLVRLPRDRDRNRRPDVVFVPFAR